MNQKLKEEPIWAVNDHPGLEPGLKERSIKESGNEFVGRGEDR